MFILLLGVAYKIPSLRMIVLVAQFLSIISGYNVVGFQRSLEACHIQSSLLWNQFYKLDMGDLQHHFLTPFLCMTLIIWSNNTHDQFIWAFSHLFILISWTSSYPYCRLCEEFNQLTRWMYLKWIDLTQKIQWGHVFGLVFFLGLWSGLET